MATTSVFGTAIGSSGPVNGVSCDLWLASRFSGQPAQGGAAPSGSPDYGPVTSATTFGSQGAFLFTGVNEGDYYARAVTSGTNYWYGPFSAVENSDVMHLSGTETVTGAKTFSGGLTVSAGSVSFPSGSVAVAAITGVLPVANGGTGSGTQNFVDLTNNQTVAGNKTFSGTPVFQAGFTVSGGTLTLPNGSIPSAAVQGLTSSFAGVDIGSTQTITGPKTVTNDFTALGSKLIGSAIGTPAAPTVTAQGATGSTTYQYQIVGVTQDARDSMPSTTGQVTNGNASLSGSNYNALSWSALNGAASYKVLRNNSGTWQLMASGITGTTWNDTGAATPQAYTPATTSPGGEAQVQSLTATTGTFSGAVTATSVGATGITGAASPARIVGATASGAPSSGTFNQGDLVVGQDGTLRVVKTAGAASAGNFVQVNPGAQLSFSVHQAAASSANPITFDTRDDDPLNLWDITNHRFVVPAGAAGRWMFTGAVTFTAGSSGSIASGIYKNGTEARRCFTANAGGITWTTPIAGSIRLVVGDIITIQITGLTTTITSSVAFNWLDGIYLGP